MLDLAIFLFSGFRQESYRGHLLMDRLWLKCLQFTGESRVVLRLEWDADLKDLAKLCENYKPKRLIFVGYSWGGQTAVNLSKEISHNVCKMFLIDPVVRRIPLFLNAMVGSTLEIPSNVLSVTVWHAGKKRFLDPVGSVVRRPKGSLSSQDSFTVFSRETHSSIQQNIRIDEVVIDGVRKCSSF